eukprot:7392490-Pyramimonas_sp.AAC.1
MQHCSTRTEIRRQVSQSDDMLPDVKDLHGEYHVGLPAAGQARLRQMRRGDSERLAEAGAQDG